MRNMSFAFTEDAIREQRKTVTRRMGWRFLKAGELVQPVRKAMGLKKGARIERMGPPIQIVSVTRERLNAITFEELEREGFPEGHPKGFPSVFIDFFCAANGCKPFDEVTRIEFAYTPSPSPVEKGNDA